VDVEAAIVNSPSTDITAAREDEVTGAHPPHQGWIRRITGVSIWESELLADLLPTLAYPRLSARMRDGGDRRTWIAGDLQRRSCEKHEAPGLLACGKDG
jgi:hypothetical protein